MLSNSVCGILDCLDLLLENQPEPFVYRDTNQVSGINIRDKAKSFGAKFAHITSKFKGVSAYACYCL